MYSVGDLLSVRDGSGQWSVGLRMIRDGGGKNTAGGIMRMIRDGGGKKRRVHTCTLLSGRC